LGLGYLHSRREQTKAFILSFPQSGAPVTKSYYLKEETRTTVRLLTDAGIEYISSNQTALIYSFRTSVYSNLKSGGFISPLNYSLALSVGLVIF